MLAARYLGDGQIDVVELEPIAPGPNEVQVAVAYTGICGTDLHILHGSMDSRVTMPAIIGHEMSGQIITIGAEVQDWQIGDPVTVMPLRWCGQCPACRSGNSHICQFLDFVGIDSTGSMQGIWTVPADLLVRLPDGLSLRDAALVEPVAVAVHDVRRADLQAGEKVVVVGGGPVGLLVASVARSTGAEVVVLEVNAYRRSVADGLGLRTLDPVTEDVAAHVQEWTADAGAAVAFEVSGSEQGAQTALDILGVRGRMVVVGIHSQPRPMNLHRVFWRELTIIGARVYQRTDFERAVELVAEGLVPVDALVSRVERLVSAKTAFGLLESGGDVMKVLIDCQNQ